MFAVATMHSGFVEGVNSIAVRRSEIGWQGMDIAMNGVSLFHKWSPLSARIITWSGFGERVADPKGLYGGTAEPEATAPHNCFQFLQ